MLHQGHRLLTAEREQRILQLLRASDVLTVSALSELLGVSEATIRRDLQGMHERGLLERVHGGAAFKPEAMPEPLFTDKQEQFTEAKQQIAAAAMAMINDFDTIFLDGGSTVLKLAQLLEGRRPLTIVTNSLMAAAQLMESGHHLILCGGEFRAISRTLVGPLSKPILESISVDKAFMGTIGFTLNDGMSTTDANEAFTKEQVMRRAKQVILLADQSKFGVRSLVRCQTDRPLDVLITNHVEEKLRQTLIDQGTRVVLCDSDK